MGISVDHESRLEAWAGSAGARLLVVFGSAALSDPGPLSDLDLALAFDELPSPRDRLRMVGELQDLAGPLRVDVVFLRPEMDPVLRFEIFRKGQALYEAEEGLMEEEAVRALFAYEDALPFRRQRREMLHRMAAEGTLVP